MGESAFVTALPLSRQNSSQTITITLINKIIHHNPYSDHDHLDTFFTTQGLGQNGSHALILSAVKHKTI